MPKLRVLTAREVIQILKQSGFELDHTTGSHYIFYHPIQKKRVTVPYKRRDIPKGTLLSILRQAGLLKIDLY